MSFQIIHITLSKPSILKFPSGMELRIANSAKKEGTAEIILDRNKIELDNVIDTTQTIDDPEVFAVASTEAKEELVIFGGPVLYKIRVDGAILDIKNLYREANLSEYGWWRVIETNVGVLCAFETGIFLISSTLMLLWFVPITILDRYVGVIDGKVVLKDDDEIEWYIYLNTGRVDRMLHKGRKK